MFVNLFQFVMKIFFSPEIAIREALEIFFLGISPKSVIKIANKKTISDGGITVDFSIIKVHTSN